MVERAPVWAYIIQIYPPQTLLRLSLSIVIMGRNVPELLSYYNFPIVQWVGHFHSAMPVYKRLSPMILRGIVNIFPHTNQFILQKHRQRPTIFPTYVVRNFWWKHKLNACMAYLAILSILSFCSSVKHYKFPEGSLRPPNRMNWPPARNPPGKH